MSAPAAEMGGPVIVHHSQIDPAQDRWISRRGMQPVGGWSASLTLAV